MLTFNQGFIIIINPIHFISKALNMTQQQISKSLI